MSPALSCLDVSIKDYYLRFTSSSACSCFPPRVCHRDRRPDLTVSGAHSPRFVSVFQKCSVLSLFVSMEVAARYSRHSPLQVGVEFGGIAASPLAASPSCRRSREISAAGGSSLYTAGGLPSSRVCRSPRRAVRGRSRHRIAETQCPPARLWLNARIWLNARRIAADSSHRFWRWFMPAGRRYP